jgi:negative regulator of flagellin synthesis FlgM
MKLPGESLVSTKINAPESKTGRVAPGSPVQRRLDSAPTVPARPTAEDSDVHLTGAARSLAVIEQSLRAQPAIDELRVAAVKERLQNGSYEIDPQRVADRLQRMEIDLSRAGPLERNLVK